MNNTPSLNEINKNSAMDPNKLTKYYKLKLMTDFMNIKYQNPKMTQSEISSQINMSSSTIKYIETISICFHHTELTQITLKTAKKGKIDDIGDLKRPQMTSNDVETTLNETVKNKKNKLKGGAMQENIEINEHYLDKILKNNNI